MSDLPEIIEVTCSKQVVYYGDDQKKHIFCDTLDPWFVPEDIVKMSKNTEWLEEEARSEFYYTEGVLRRKRSIKCERAVSEDVYFSCANHPEWSYGVFIRMEDNGACSFNRHDRPVVRVAEILESLYALDSTDQQEQKEEKTRERDVGSMPNNACKDLKGRQFGKLTVIERGENDKNRHARWWCECDCGKKILVSSTALLNSHQESCGHDHPKTITHGESSTRLYKIYSGMKQRCYNPKHLRYKDYGGRGIHICDEWRNDYTKFSDWARANGYTDDLSIDRIDVDGNYEPGNCRWIPMSEQSANRRMCSHQPKT